MLICVHLRFQILALTDQPSLGDIMPVSNATTLICRNKPVLYCKEPIGALPPAPPQARPTALHRTPNALLLRGASWTSTSLRALEIPSQRPLGRQTPSRRAPKKTTYRFAAAPIQTSRYSPTISAAVGPRGLFPGLPEASA